MDVLDIIRSEHREVGDLIDRAGQCEPGDERLVDLARQIQERLSVHLAVEERLFYAQLRDRAEEREQQVDVFEAYTEHAVAKSLMELLAKGRKPDAKFKAELQVLGESVKHHVKEEESKVFGIARDLLDKEDREDIGEAWQAAKKRATERASRTNGAHPPKRKPQTSARRKTRT